MSGYPITLEGENFYANADNRDANGGCFVGRDVHSNPGKDTDGAETPEHLNPVGQWLSDNVFNDGNSGERRSVVHQLSPAAGSGDLEGRELVEPGARSAGQAGQRA